MAIGSGTAGFAQGLASGFQTGARYGIEAEDMRARRDMEGRRLKMAEDAAALNQKTGQLQYEALERSAAKQKGADEAWQKALAVLTGGEGFDGDDPTMPAEQRFGRALVGRKPNAAQWTQAANILSKAGLKEGIDYMNFAHNAMQEGAVDLLRAMSSGDMEGAKRAYNATGVNRLKNIGPVQGPDGNPGSQYVFEFEDGSKETYDPKTAFEMLTSPSAYQRYVSEQQKTAREVQKDEADIAYKKAQAINQLDDNPTKIRVAEIGAESREGIADMRYGDGGGGGAGRSGSRGGRGGGIADDAWKGAEQRQKVLSEVDAYVAQNFGDAGDPSGKARHNEESRRISAIASQIYGAAVDGGQPMSVADAARLAREGRASFGRPKVVNGRLVAQQSWEVNGVSYPMGAASKPVTTEQANEYLRALAARFQGSGKTLTREQLQGADDIAAIAKATGKSVDAVIDEILGARAKPAAPTKPPKAGAGAKAGIAAETPAAGGKGLPWREPGSGGGAAPPRPGAMIPRSPFETQQGGGVRRIDQIMGR